MAKIPTPTDLVGATVKGLTKAQRKAIETRADTILRRNRKSMEIGRITDGKSPEEMTWEQAYAQALDEFNLS